MDSIKKDTIIKILGIVSLVVVVNIFVLLFAYKTLKAPRKSITTKEFINRLESKKFEIYDTKDQFENMNHIEEATLALSLDETYKIEFYIISSEEEAIEIFNNNINIFKSESIGKFTYVSKDISNFSKYEQTSNDKYSVVSRIGNTLIYLNVDLKYKDSCKKILKELGY